ncbi:late competence development ComFB family protein [Zhongshania aliphaticivorans]|uniref:late competence development ComFB family protein n=1 Tax=Zhongshania aliphaticivorans TaxID=1470434 RepID=UPI0012E53CD9|nr:late competence development ComFB family protein [Zhongshania aliphaticivorans]CAA0107826.1 Uncharacterised protein [Zhongshania aliphaticivorans]
MLISDRITNFSEILLEDAITKRQLEKSMSDEHLQDVICLTLNQLRPQYVKSTMDMRINLSPEEYQSALRGIDTALEKAINIVKSGRREAMRD